MTHVKRGLDLGLRWLCIGLFAVLVLVVVWQVFTRQVLSAPSTWSEELAKYIFIWLGLFGAALVFGERGHIAVDAVARRLPERAQRWNAVLGQVVIGVFAAAVLVYGGWQVSELAWNQSMPGLPLKVGWLYLALPLSGFLVLFYTVYHLVAVVRGVENATTDGEPEAI
ncbi:TRAP transporter small permease [Promicromonospora panici]|uniref:TRAP transporter small permease n=1 Tax=Promicromonospora panici TaxID=2219658 RepID=UPI00101D86A5|nr:TRAP transporter small permease [Promicromonospora panici]